MMKSAASALFSLLALILSGLSPVFAGPGDLDVSFGGAGKVTADFGSNDSGSSVVVQSDGKIVVAGTSGAFPVFGTALVRYHSDGTLDTSFNGTGLVTTAPAFGKTSGGSSMAVQGDGKIVVARSAVIERYLANGTLDMSFNGTGSVSVGFGRDVVFSSRTTAVQSDGKIVVVGQLFDARVSEFGTSDTALVRYNADGTLDESFNRTGKVTTYFGGNLDSAGNSVALQSDGKIVVTGLISDPALNDSSFALLRYHADGSLDTTFNGTGKVITDLGSAGAAVAIQDDDKIIVVTKAGGLARYLSDGSLDTSFNGTGIVGFASFATGNGVAVQGDGKIVVTGDSSSGGTGFDFALLRYQVDGTLDTSFGGTGMVTTDFTGDDRANGVALQPDGKIVVAGSSGAGDFAVARYVVPPSPIVTKPSATGVTRNAASLHASVHPNGQATMAHFEYGTDPNLAGATTTSDVALGSGSVAVALDQDLTGLASGTTYYFRAVGTNATGAGQGAIHSFVTIVVPEPVANAGDDVPGEVAGTTFLAFGSPAIDGGLLGGAATIRVPGSPPETVIYGDASGTVLARTGGPAPGDGTFTALGDPVFAGEAIGFAAVAQATATMAAPLAIDLRFGIADLARLTARRSGSRVAGLYSQLTRAAGLSRLAVQGGSAPGAATGSFAKFPNFGLPRSRAGLIFTGNLRRGGAVTKANDFGVWREKSAGGDSDLLLRNGSPITLAAGGSRDVKKVNLIAPVAMASDQRRSFAPDGGVAASATFQDGKSGVVRVAADGSVDVPVDNSSAVPDETGASVAGVSFSAFNAPATASGGRYAFLAALRGAAGVRPPSQAIFALRDGTLRSVMRRGDPVPGFSQASFGRLGEPLLGEGGMIGLVAALSGRNVPPAGRQAIFTHRDGATRMVARLSQPAAEAGEGVTYQRFLSVVVTDTPQARLVFTATLRGAGVNGANKQGLWSVTPAGTVKLLLRTGSTITVGASPARVRTLDALQAKPANRGQGRSTDATGFVTAKVKLDDGRTGVLRIPVP